MSLYGVAHPFSLREMTMKKSCQVLLILLSTVSMAGCTSSLEGEWQRLNAVQFHDNLSNTQDAFLLDTRTQIEWEDDGHIEDATLIPHDEIKQRQDELPEDKKTTILLYCRSGNRSQTAAQTLLDLGYTDVRDLESGIKGWKNQGYPVLYGP